MTVCRYFRNGYCRNGDSCRFEHTSYNSRPPLLNTPTAYHTGYSTGYGARGYGGGAANEWRNQEQQPQPSMVDQIIGDIDSMLRGKQYLYSCIPGRQPHLNCKVLCDLSPEEIRVKYMECKAANDEARFLSEMSSLKIFVEGTLRQISRNPSMLDDAQSSLASSVIQAPPHSETSPSANLFVPPPYGASVGTASSPFSGFGTQSPQSFGSMAPMSQTQQGTAPVPIMQMAQDTMKPRMLFGKTQSSSGLFDNSSPPQPTFQQASHTPPIGFPMGIPPPVAQPMPSQPGFQIQQMSQAAQHVPNPPAQGLFTMPNPAPPVAPQQTSEADDVYSCLMEMSPEDLAAYQDRAFTIAGVPLMPPAREHCF